MLAQSAYDKIEKAKRDAIDEVYNGKHEYILDRIVMYKDSTLLRLNGLMYRFKMLADGGYSVPCKEDGTLLPEK